MSRRSDIRQDLGAILADGKRRVVQHSLELTADGATVRVVVVGNADVARALDRELRVHLAALGEPKARVAVWAIPDASDVTALATRLDDLPPPVAPEPPAVAARRGADAIAEAVRAAWPRGDTGTLLSTWVEYGPTTRIRVVHVGTPLGDAGRQLLARAVRSEGPPPTILEDALQPLDAAATEGVAWLGPALQLAERARSVPAVNLCVTVLAPVEPAPTGGRQQAPGAAEDPSGPTIRAAINQALAGRPGVTIVTGDAWHIVPTTSPCPVASAPAAPAQP